MSYLYTVMRGERKLGAFSRPELIAAVTNGNVRRRDQVQMPGESAWVSAEHVPELRAAFANAGAQAARPVPLAPPAHPPPVDQAFQEEFAMSEPGSEIPLAPGGFDHGRTAFRSPHTFGIVAIILLACTTGTGVLINYLNIALLDHYDYVGELSQTGEAILVFIGILAIVFLISFIGAIIMFMAWLRRAYGNLSAFHYRRKHGLGWAIGGWFVPFYSLYKPGAIGADLERGSRHGVGEMPRASNAYLWWALFLVSNIWSRVDTTLWESESVEWSTAIASTWFLILIELASGAAAIWFIVTVNRLQARASSSGTGDVLGSPYTCL